MSSHVSVAIHGAAGRMGQRLVALGSQDPALRLVAALEHPQHPQLGKDAGVLARGVELGVPLTTDWSEKPRVVIDFSLPEGVESLVARCAEQGVALVLATTGLSETTQEAIHEATATIPIVWAPSMSLAVNLTMKLAAAAGRALKDQDADVEILERHHRFKEDAPSGTALRFGQIIADAMELTHCVHGREGQTGARPHDEIGYHAIRTGDDPGQHTIIFGMLGETVELTVRASNRDCYVKGALAAAKFVVNQPPGLYSMEDVLGI
ncbi:MAG: 4-hydroxy-tetrahydrodipicolinate reductase [Planctomycetales bacterium]|nr:4-hydroxy-tetrahydrodipicolinate reductase [Planctomycetales bacterium]